MDNKQHAKLKSLIEQLESELTLVDSAEHHSTIATLKTDLQVLKKQISEETQLSSLNTEEENSPFLEASVNFEESHPKLATVLNDIAYLLNNIGI